MVFPKLPTTIEQEIDLWRKRGLVIADEALAIHYLKFIGYYRLSAYALAHQDIGTADVINGLDKPFFKGTTFEDVFGLYVFDRELRLLVIDAVERIEVAFRSAIINTMCCKHNPHWFMDKTLFSAGNFGHAEFIERIEKELGIDPVAKKPYRDHNETSINHYYRKYGEPYLPPAWMIAEVMPIGVWSRVFKGLKSGDDRKAIAQHFAIDESVLKSWLHCLTYVRNMCAHHSRLWNRRFVIKVARKHPKDASVDTHFYTAFWIIRELIEKISPNTAWALQFATLIKQHPKVPIAKMGFPEDWKLI